MTAADILVLAGPIWLVDSSVMKRVIERLYGCSGSLNGAGQYAYYGHVARARLTSTPGRVARRTTSPTATSPS